jgi:predicted ABC-type ATPase
VTSLFAAGQIIVAVAGPNGAGKSTFYHAHLAAAGLRYVNADELSHDLSIDPADAAELAGALRQALIEQRESFVFETELSDPVGEKVEQLRHAADLGYTVVLCFIGIGSAAISEERVAIRVLQGGHDVPGEKLVARFPRALANLELAIRVLPHVLVFDNSDLAYPFRKIAEYHDGRPVYMSEVLPMWFRTLPGHRSNQ